MIGLSVAFAALASQVHYEEIPLEQVAQGADAAVIVEVGPDGMRAVEIPIPGSAEKSCGTYGFGAWRVTVREVVNAPFRGPVLAPGQVINVFPGNTPELISMSQMACLGGMTHSPIFFSYEGETVDPGDRLLVLLKWSPPYGWVEATAGSWVSPKKAAAVKEPMGRYEDETTVPPPDLSCIEDADCAEAARCHDMHCFRPAPPTPAAP